MWERNKTLSCYRYEDDTNYSQAINYKDEIKPFQALTYEDEIKVH